MRAGNNKKKRKLFEEMEDMESRVCGCDSVVVGFNKPLRDLVKECSPNEVKQFREYFERVPGQGNPLYSFWYPLSYFYLTPDNLNPWEAYNPMISNIRVGNANNQRIGNQINVKKITLKVKPFYDASIDSPGNTDCVSVTLVYAKHFKNNDQISRYDTFLHSSFQPAVNRTRVSVMDRDLDISQIGEYEVLAFKEFNMNAWNATNPVNTPFNVNNLHYNIVSEHQTTWSIDLDVDFIATFRADRLLYHVNPSWLPNPSNCSGGQLYLLWTNEAVNNEAYFTYKVDYCVYYTDA